MNGPQKKIRKKKIRTRTEREREREQCTFLHKNIAVGRDCKEPFIYLIFDFRSFPLYLNPWAKPNLIYPHSLHKYLLVQAQLDSTNFTILSEFGLPNFCILTVVMATGSRKFLWFILFDIPSLIKFVNMSESNQKLRLCKSEFN